MRKQGHAHKRSKQQRLHACLQQQVQQQRSTAAQKQQLPQQGSRGTQAWRAHAAPWPQPCWAYACVRRACAFGCAIGAWQFPTQQHPGDPVELKCACTHAHTHTCAACWPCRAADSASCSCVARTAAAAQSACLAASAACSSSHLRASTSCAAASRPPSRSCRQRRVGLGGVVHVPDSVCMCVYQSRCGVPASVVLTSERTRHSTGALSALALPLASRADASASLPA